MAGYFFDSSAITKRYTLEVGTAWVRNLVDPAAGNLNCLAWITGAEVVAALGRRFRLGSLSAAQFSVALGQFRSDFNGAYRLVDITPALVFHAMNLAEIHALRGYDAVQLAAAFVVSADCAALGISFTLISADVELNAAAMAGGFAVEDPNLRP